MEVVFMKPDGTDIDLYPDLTGCSSIPYSLSVNLVTVFEQRLNWHCVLTILFTNEVDKKEAKKQKRLLKMQAKG